MNRIILVLFAILCSFNGFAQNDSAGVSKISTVSIKIQYIQIKDEFNYGLVFTGPNLVAAYSFSKVTDNGIFRYSPEIAFGGVFNKGAGFAWRFKPIDVFYGSSITTKHITFGGYVATDYQWQQYSELQGGRLFWFSTIEIGPRIEYVVPYKSWDFSFDFSNSLAGFTTRPEPSTESYYYDFSFSEFISVAKQNLTFGSYNLFTRTKVGVTVEPNSWKRFSIGYSFEYFGYYKDPTLRFMNHSINLNLKI